MTKPPLAKPSEPSWLRTARTYIGVRETVGPKHSPTIMGWIKRLGKRLGVAVNDDETAWCGTFVAVCFMDALPSEPTPAVAVRAKAWADFGRPIAEAVPGTVLVFSRTGGGHVGFYVGEDATSYHVLGGNQGNAVSVVRIAKDRCIAKRWPVTVMLTGAPVQLSAASGQSVNEA